MSIQEKSQSDSYRPNGSAISRRQMLCSGLAGAGGLLLADRLVPTASAVPPAKAKSVIQIWMWGGPAHLDTFDPKPDAGKREFNNMPIDKNTVILRKYKKPVINALKDLREKRLLRETCRERLGNINPARLTELIKGDRELTTYYVALLLKGGVVNLKQLLQGKKIEKLPEPERSLFEWFSLQDSPNTVRLISESKTLGIDVDKELAKLIKKAKKK